MEATESNETKFTIHRHLNTMLNFSFYWNNNTIVKSLFGDDTFDKFFFGSWESCWECRVNNKNIKIFAEESKIFVNWGRFGCSALTTVLYVEYYTSNHNSSCNVDTIREQIPSNKQKKDGKLNKCCLHKFLRFYSFCFSLCALFSSSDNN